MAKLATAVVGIVLCWLLVAGGAVVGAFTGTTLSTSSRPSLGASMHIAWLAALAAARQGRGLLLLLVTLADPPTIPE
jgi:hypothetical protein